MSQPQLERLPMKIGDKYFCFFEFGFAKRSREFLAGLDPEYYDFISAQMLPLLEDDAHRQRAAATLRMTYSHALESLFAFIAATRVTYEAIPQWLSSYEGELVKEVENIRHPVIDGKRRTLTKNPFETIAEEVLEGAAYEDETALRFGRLWWRFSEDFLNFIHKEEYNNLKHGFRIRMGGYSLSIGVEDEPGISAPADRMRRIGNSDFGSRYYEREKLAKYNFRINPTDHNWNPKKYVVALQLISMSLRNIISHSQCQVGVNPKSVVYKRPDRAEAYDAPWVYDDVGTQLTAFIRPMAITPDLYLTKEQIIEQLNEFSSE